MNWVKKFLGLSIKSKKRMMINSRILAKNRKKITKNNFKNILEHNP
jgi:hypothetical protein